MLSADIMPISFHEPSILLQFVFTLVSTIEDTFYPAFQDVFC